MADLTGTTIQNQYFLKKLIGKGRMANVYLGWDKKRAHELAVKVLHSELANDSRFFRMFKKETDFMGKLPHPNIVRLYDFGIDKKGNEKIAFIVMDYKVCNLRHLIARRAQPLSLDETSQVLFAMCKALYFAHQSKVFHCDVKSANILLSHDEKSPIYEKDVFLADFGISRWALEQAGGGTPAYMAPELFEGGIVTEQTEIYAMGVTLYEMLSGGQLPFKGESSSHGSNPRKRIAWEKANKPLPPLQQFNPALSSAVISVVEKALNKDPGLRHSTIIEVAFEFEAACKQKAIPQIPDQETIAVPIQLPPAVPKEIGPFPPVVRHTDQPHLLGIMGEKAGQVIPISGQNLTIGRSQGNMLRITDRTVSRLHASITRTRHAFYICDEGSTLGTFLNGRPIPPNKPILIKDGDRIEIGYTQLFEFRLK